MGRGLKFQYSFEPNKVLNFGRSSRFNYKYYTY